ncbi:MAG: hypothetical protein EB132_05865 [Actinobacteria bacterium]|nr:hypothetical protein [Actinomycetota bacterium]
MVIDVTDATFQTEVIDASQTTPVVVDLWAPWCGPCKTLGPILEKVVGETGGKVILAKVNVDENPAIAQAFRAQSIPMVVAIDKGRPVDGFTGSYPDGILAVVWDVARARRRSRGALRRLRGMVGRARATATDR